MESNWRWNVWVYGMQISDWLLCARITSSGSLVVVNPDSAFPTKYRLFNIATPSGVPALVTRGDIPAAHPHFPYGVPVLPDN